MRNIGLQVYTVRESLQRDYKGTLEQVAAAGYDGVEIGDMGGMTTSEFGVFLGDIGLKLIGSYVPICAPDAELNAVLDRVAALGGVTAGVAFMGPEYRTSEGIRTAARWLDHAGALAAQRNVAFMYHAHAFEFETLIDGEAMFDVLFALTDPALVKWQPDSYWVAKGGRNPVTEIARFAGRAPTCHLKDMSGDGKQSFEIVGNGQIDFDAIMKAGDAAGVRWYIVEQDLCPKGEIESMRESFDNIVARGWR
jgi:sugar phosphate isomerase/epimerase